LLPELDAREGRAADRLFVIAHEDEIILLGFDWPSWRPEAERLVEQNGIESADLETCRRLLTVLTRQERFVENSLRGHVESGVVAQLVRRLAELTTAARHERGGGES
jgi:hypothetical protein